MPPQTTSFTFRALAWLWPYIFFSLYKYFIDIYFKIQYHFNACWIRWGQSLQTLPTQLVGGDLFLILPAFFIDFFWLV